MVDKSNIFILSSEEDDEFANKSIENLTSSDFITLEHRNSIDPDILPNLNSTSVVVAFTTPEFSTDEAIDTLHQFRETGAEVFIVPSGLYISPNEQNLFSETQISLRDLSPADVDRTLESLANKTLAIATPLNPENPFFISYSNLDRHAAQILKDLCDRNSIKTWMASKDLNAGDDWKNEIDEKISIAPAVLLLLSPNSMNSHYVTYEWSYSMGLEKNIVPLLVNPCNNLHPKIEELHYIDLDDHEKVIDAIRSNL